MSVLFRRHTPPTCFFCQSLVTPPPPNVSNFCCPTCRCWNRYDRNGEILSDEPAMHDEVLNRKSFAKRASPSKNRLPTVYGKGPFCHNCQTNQTLLVNLLANYLPPTESPEYAKRVAQLPEYRASLDARYPPVCDACAPAVEDEIKEKDSMARLKALSGWLKQSKGKEQHRRVSGPKEREQVVHELFWWKSRGALCLLSTLASVTYDVSGAFGHPPSWILRISDILPYLSLVSAFWHFWDPTYSSLRRSQIQGRDVRVHGKAIYIGVQILVWLSRFTTAVLLSIGSNDPLRDYLHLHQYPSSSLSCLYFSVCFAIELSAPITALFVLRIQHPPAIRLVDTKSHTKSRSSTPSQGSFSSQLDGYTSARASPAPPPGDMDLLASLTLSSKPVITPTKPVFGSPSLSNKASSQPAPDRSAMDQDDDDSRMQVDDAMDWTPTDPSRHRSPAKRRAVPENDDGTWVRPQRFFAPEKPTGLEGLFERTRLADESESESRESNGRRRHAWAWRWRWIYLLSLLPIVLGGATWRYRSRRRMATIHATLDYDWPQRVLERADTGDSSILFEPVSPPSLSAMSE
ncbi:hypothetical protein HGRIS_008125 [Hohenbuehelia grisea]|uniref:Ima1 N-terminal domain-containing protein n=1 Tax=Hohenbuehelia grisea TaxID=104357 RepID=A0ABR3J784_9AGAR